MIVSFLGCSTETETSVPEEEAAPSVGRIVPPRAPEPWQNQVRKIQAEFRRDPLNPRFAKRPRSAKKPVMAANEASPTGEVLVTWYCDPNSPDAWDEMWMTIISEAVKNDNDAWVYLQGSGSAATLKTKCGNLLKTEKSIELDRVHFITGFENDAFWIRDFGPLFVRNQSDSELSIRDAEYYNGRPNDDAQPADFAERIKVPVSDLNLYFQGGNFLPNGGGLCIVGSVVRGGNPQYTVPELEELFKAELGCEKLVLVRSLEDFATGHVDMWLSWANRTTLLVGEYTEGQDSENHDIIEKNVTDLLSGLTDPASGEPINIVRVPMPTNCPASFGGDAPQSCNNTPGWNRVWRTYLNVLEINGKVLVPVFSEDDDHEKAALDVWKDQGFDVVPVSSDHIITSAGSIHCITKSIDAVP